MYFRLTALAVLALLALTLASVPAQAGSMPVIDTTITVQPSGAMHIKVVETVPDDPTGATDFRFDLQKIYQPENVSIYDAGTGRPLKYDIKETADTYGYNVHYDRPYYNGYTFVVEYDSHKRIIYEGAGVYSLGMRPAIDTRMMDRTYTVVLPWQNFTYLGYKETLDHPASVTDGAEGKVIAFHNVSNVNADYAWELRFRAQGIDAEVRQLSTEPFQAPVPGMSFMAAIAALVIIAIFRDR